MKSHRRRACRPARMKPLRVALGVFVFIACGLAFYAIMPYLLPVRLQEGPLVQMVGPGRVELSWYTTKAADGAVELPGERRIAADRDGVRCAVDLDGLAPATDYPYRVLSGERELFTGRFRLPPAGKTLHFIVLGDTGKGTRAQYYLGTRIARAEPDIVVHTGDVVYPGGERFHYDNRFFTPYRAILARIPFFPSLGNHDVGGDEGSLPYRAVFALPDNGPPGLTPEHNYWFDAGPARFAIIDSNLPKSSLAANVAPWLRSVFDEAAPAWRFVVLHHPPYTCGGHAPDVDVRAVLVPVFEECGVAIVFSGHDHMYERTVPMFGGEAAPDGRGVVYVVSGAGGARLYDLQPVEQRADYFAVLNNSQHSYTDVHIEGPDLTLQQVSVDGDVLDEWSWRRSAPDTPADSQPAADVP